MHPAPIFNTEKYLPFNFYESWRQVTQCMADEKNHFPSANGYFVALSHEITADREKHFVDISPVFIKKQQITVGKDLPVKTQSEATAQFKQELIKAELDWIIQFLNIISAHLEQRESESMKLTNHPNVRILMGETVQHIEELHNIVIASEMSQSTLCYAAQVIRMGCNQLAKLAGGRAFLTGSIIEMLCTFEVINKIYLI